MTPTADPYCFIESVTRKPTLKVVYIIPSTGERWQISGTCNLCGDCWVGAKGGAPDKDCPVRPEIKANYPNCTLTGAYLASAAPA